MYKAKYEYKSALPEYLSFRAGDQFTVLKQANKDWFQAQNGRGQIGYVPCNYVTPLQQVSQEEILKFVDWSIQAIHLQAASEDSGQYTHQQRGTLQKLVKHRSDLAGSQKSRAPLEKTQSEDVGHGAPGPQTEMARHHSEKRRAPPPPPPDGARQQSVKQNVPTAVSPSQQTCSPQNNAGSPDSLNSTQNQKTSQEDANSVADHISNTDVTMATLLPSSQTSSCHPADMSGIEVADGSPFDLSPVKNSLSPSHAGSESSSCPAASVSTLQDILKEVQVPDKIGPELLEEVRKNTGLSFDKSKVAVETVLGYIGFKVPALEGLMDQLLTSLHFGRDISDEDITSHDAQRLDVIFSELTACKDDSQQRSWALHEDESIIQEYLQELLSILENAKPSICRKVVSKDNYDILHNLVQYYQMETRETLCRSLLKVFGALCSLEKEVVANLLYSVLPLELAQDLTHHTDDIQRVCYTALLMTMLFSTGDNVSMAVTDQLNEEFFLHILNLTENPPSPQFEDDAVDLLISFVLAFNLHLLAVDTNVVLRSLASFGAPKVFTERIMLLINRGEDPVKIFDFKPLPRNSVVKLFHDLYSDLTTSDLLYTNDAKVLMDVILGRLTNLGPGDKVRSSFLVLCQKVVQNSSYSDHRHRAQELQRCLQTICSEEADTPDDKRVALDILCSNADIFPA